jgi:hypothetical protein
MKNQPIHEVRLGFIKAAVWKNDTETGVRYNVTFNRLYKDGDHWRSTESFGRDDLLLLAKVADKTHSWICARNQEEHGATSPRARSNAGPEAELIAHQPETAKLAAASHD